MFGHGGGYVSGSVKLYSHFLQWLADETGATVFGPQYRLAPRRMWPGQFDEIMESIVYVYDNAEELGINKDKIIIAGDGTGATSTYAAALQLASNGRKVGEEYQRNFLKLSLPSLKIDSKVDKTQNWDKNFEKL